MLQPARRRSGKTAGLFIAGSAAFIFSVLYNGLVHLVVLGSANRQMEPLRCADFSSKIWISLAGTLAVSFLFTGIYVLFSREKNVRTGAFFGLLFGLAAAVLVDLNQYVIYPLPFALAAAWSFFGVIEFTLLGAIVGSIMRDKA